MSVIGDASTGEVAVFATGEIDLATVRNLERALRQACDLQPAHVVVDFSAVTFCDSQAVVALVAAANELTARGATIEIRSAPRSLRRMVQVLDLESVLALH